MSDDSLTGQDINIFNCIIYWPGPNYGGPAQLDHQKSGSTDVITGPAQNTGVHQRLAFVDNQFKK